MKQIKLSASLWVALGIVAGARVAKADEWRKPEQNRGAHRNRINDLTGCVGEFAAIAAAAESGAAITHEFFDASGPVKRPDFIAADKGFDAKALMIDATRRYFIIDRKALASASSKGISAFVPVIARAYGDRALIGSRISIAEACSWPLKDFGYGATPALSLDELAQSHFGVHASQLPNATGLDVFGSGGASLMESAFVHGATLQHAGINAKIQGKQLGEALLMLADDYAQRRMNNETA
jgi:hypothetical protein